MNWSDEPYVRIYRRDTVDTIAWGHEARGVCWDMLRACDRSGVIELGKHGLRGLAALIHWPAESVERSIPILRADGVIRTTETAIVFPNYIPAQTSTKSDALRKQEQRERNRDSKLANVTVRDEQSQKRDAVSRVVPSVPRTADAGSRDVTQCSAVHSVQGSAVPAHAPAREEHDRSQRPSGVPKSEWLAYREGYLAKYTATVREITGVVSWSMPPFGHRDLEQVLRDCCLDGARSDVEGWIEKTLRRYAESEPTNYDPSRLITWLNKTGIDEANEADDEPPPYRAPEPPPAAFVVTPEEAERRLRLIQEAGLDGLDGFRGLLKMVPA